MQHPYFDPHLDLDPDLLVIKYSVRHAPSSVPICRWTSYTCEVCGEKHSRWTISDPTRLQAHFKMAGAPYLPHFRIVNTRNIWAVFHRYNVKYNKGSMSPTDGPPPQKAEPPEAAPTGASPSSPAPAGAEPALTGTLKGDGDGDNVAAAHQRSKGAEDGEDEGYDDDGIEDDDCNCTAMEEELTARRKAAERDRLDGEGEAEAEAERYKGHCLGPNIWGKTNRYPMCCCQYRQISAMELQTFWTVRPVWMVASGSVDLEQPSPRTLPPQICQDNRTIRHALKETRPA